MTRPFPTDTDRRTMLKGVGVAALAALTPTGGRAAAAAVPTWVSTTQAAPWRTMTVPTPTPGIPGFTTPGELPDVFLNPSAPLQTVSGFGAAFSELSWDALSRAAPAQREQALDLLFRRGAGLNLSLCRTPIGASDFARDWYSYNETPDDFAMKRFSIARDRSGLLPLIKAAQARRPDLKIWASPWSPPTWMKTNRHYAQAPSRPGQPANGLLPKQIVREGQDGFIQEDRYFKAYARYFRSYVEAYGKAGVPISVVMPQNEFNSAQPFPSCCWTPEGLGRFLPHLGQEMDAVGASVFLGTLERPKAELITRAIATPEAARVVKGLGVQWAGKGALAELHQHHAGLPIWATEQECGDGKNDWRYARYAWNMMRTYFDQGAEAYMYWNIALPKNPVSTWGWRQNSLFTVDPATGEVTTNHEFYILRHASGFVEPGARRITTMSVNGYENLLAFRNADGGLVLIIQNDLSEPTSIRVALGARTLAITLPADSLNTISIPAGQG